MPQPSELNRALPDRGIAIRREVFSLYGGRVIALHEQSALGAQIASPVGGLAMHGGLKPFVPYG